VIRILLEGAKMAKSALLVGCKQKNDSATARVLDLDTKHKGIVRIAA